MTGRKILCINTMTMLPSNVLRQDDCFPFDHLNHKTIFPKVCCSDIPNHSHMDGNSTKSDDL